jgi:hypothetical protein
MGKKDAAQQRTASRTSTHIGIDTPQQEAIRGRRAGMWGRGPTTAYTNRRAPMPACRGVSPPHPRLGPNLVCPKKEINPLRPAPPSTVKAKSLL